MLEAGFLLEHTAAARMAKVRDLLQRATVRAEEVALLREWCANCAGPSAPSALISPNTTAAG